MTFQADILLVDDNPDNLRLLGAMLSDQGYDVRQTVSGDAALRAAYMHPPDLILLDINMPIMDGYEVCRHLKSSSQTHDVPVIFISALDFMDNKLKAFEVGGVDYITKPFHKLEVLARVKNQLTIQEQRQQLLEQNHQLQLEIRRRQHAEHGLQRLNMDLERQVKARTAELQLAFEFEATLKRITDQVRDTLDENKILSTAVAELAHAIGVGGCNASLYDLKTNTAVIVQEHTVLPGAYQNRRVHLDMFPEIYGALMRKEPIQFCSLVSNPDRGLVSTLACPIFDEQGILGDIWLVHHTYYAFHQQDIRLVEQVANQCAIAIRQARLFQTAQTQVNALERLNQLKDDFVSTVSHELRTPMSTIKAVTQILENELPPFQSSVAPSTSDKPVSYYLGVLREECDREIKLINDLLYLSGIDLEEERTDRITISPVIWLPYVIEPFEARIAEHQCHLQTDIPPDLPDITTNISYLERILTELLNNACKYTPSGETIRVSADALTDHLTIRVSNSGVQIPEEECDRIFDKFYRIPKSDPWKYEGTGLGLALVQKLASYLDADITVESQNNETTFAIRLPLLP